MVVGLVDKGVIWIIVGKNFGLINVENLCVVYIEFEVGIVVGKIVLEGFE